jgi:hypothetical protein
MYLKLDNKSPVEKLKERNQIDYSDYKSPLERTLEILTSLKECIEDDKFIRDIDY